MNLLSRVKHPRLLLHPRTLTRTSSTPQLPHATPTAAFSSGRPIPYKLRPTSSPRGAYIRYLTTPLLPNTSTTSIFASSNPLLPHKAASQMSSSASTPASTQPFASSTPSKAPPAGSNQNTNADASHPHPLGRPRGEDDLDPGNSSSNDHGNSSSSMEKSSSSAQNSQDPASSGDNGGGSLPALPAPDHGGSTSSSDGSATTTLEVDGKAVVLDHLGPMVIGRDGTVSRISNWQEMSERERQNTLRILGKRNQVRLAALRGEEAGGSGSSSSKAA